MCAPGSSLLLESPRMGRERAATMNEEEQQAEQDALAGQAAYEAEQQAAEEYAAQEAANDQAAAEAQYGPEEGNI